MVTAAPILTLTIDIPHGDGGEDAPPVSVLHEFAAWIGVFDGMGGAGATSYEVKGELRTGAYIASRVAASSFESWANEHPRATGMDFSPSLHAAQAGALQDELADLHPPATRLKSRLLRALPTTLAVAGVDTRNPYSRRQCNIVTMWSGDSRVYLMMPAYGLIQVTRDHLTSGGDAQENLGSDSPLSNCLSADGRFFVEETQIQADMPFVLIAATDGCFGYVETPVMFEELVLSELNAAESLEEWRNALIGAISSITGDDASLVMALVGWKNFAEVKSAYRDRLQVVQAMAGHIRSAAEQLRQAKDDVDRLERDWRTAVDEVWASYKHTFEMVRKTTRYGDI